MRVFGLFSGIGGFEVGLQEAGHTTLASCERWAPARAVLKARLASVECHPDVRALTDLPSATDLLTAGFPCQDLSQAGRTSGISGDNSSLVSNVFRLIDKRSVPWVLLENVPFMLHLERGAAMRMLVEAFEARGYRWAYRSIDSRAWLPQRRQRVYFLASRTGDPSEVLFAEDHPPPTTTTALCSHAHGFYWTEGTRGLGWAPDSVPTLKNGSTIGIPSPPAISMPEGVIVTPDIRDAERLQGFREDWTKPAEAVARASLRWSLVGNAVSVPVVRWIGGRFDGLPASVNDSKRPLDENRSWPRAANFDGKRRYEVCASSFPTRIARVPLHRWLVYPSKLLSARATAGFLGRARKSRLRFADGFLERVEAHLDRMKRVDDALVSSPRYHVISELSEARIQESVSR